MRTSINLDFLKRPVLLLTLLGLLVIGLIWWFAWMSPEANKLSNINQQQAVSQSQITQLHVQIVELQAEAALVQKELPYLSFFQSEIPPVPDQGDLTKQLYELSLKSSTFISSLDDSTITAPTVTATGTSTTGSTGTAAPSTSYSEMPITIDLTGSRNGVLAFIQGVYKLSRLVTIQGVTLTPPSTAANIDHPNRVKGFTATITATAYTTYTPPAATST